MTKTQIYTHIVHTIPPIFDKNSKILILGSLPSVKSREVNFYYGHPQNRFWQVTAAVFEAPLPQTVTEKRDFLLSNNIALWDVISECDIIGSSDASIKNVKVNDITEIVKTADIRAIYTNGSAASRLFERFTLPALKEYISGIPHIHLPSTSPANASFSCEKLISAWKIIKGKNMPK